jgi:sugar phosphate isomerase/epimerase
MTGTWGVQLYSLRDELAADRDGSVRRLAGIGYGAVEPFDPTADPRGFRRLADELGLEITSTHAFQLLEEPERTAELLDDIAELGAELAIIPGSIPHKSFTTGDGIKRAAETLNGIADRARGHGIRLGYHNHWWEIEPTFDGRHAIELLADHLSDDVVLEVDTYWAAVGGADPAALLCRLGDRVGALHVKDGPVRKGEPHVAVGTGAMPVREILAAAPRAARIVEFDQCATDIFEALAASHAYLTGLAER